MSEYHHGNLKEELLNEGLKLLKDEGVSGFSLRKLARKCNVSHTSPYRHFSDKEDLICAISSRIETEFNEALQAALDSTPEGSSGERLKALGKGYVCFFLEHPDYLDLLFLSPEIGNLKSEDKSDSESSFMTFFDKVAAGNGKKTSGKISGEGLRPWCLIHGLTVLLAKKAVPVPTEDIDRLIDEVLV